MKSNQKKITSNLLVGFGGQIITIALGIVLPRLLLTSFGSEVNGLLSAITQIYSYIAILEAGIGAASLNALYKCFANEDRNGVAETLSATKRYFRRVSNVYALCVLVATIVFPFVFNSSISKTVIAAVVLLQGLSGLVNFYFVASYEQLILADGKAYVSALINLLVTVLSYTARIVAIALGANVVVVQIAFFFVSVSKALILYWYYKRNYPWISYNKKADLSILKQRGAFMVHEITGVINSGCGVVLISLFCDLKQTSIYTVYSLIYNNLHTLMNKVSGSVDYYLGQLYHKNLERYRNVHAMVETCYVSLAFAIFTSAFCLTLPFIRLYTAGVEDANYLDEFLPYLFVVAECMSAARLISSKLILISGNAKNTRFNTILEASITLAVSLLLVPFMGVKGALVGLICSSLYRTNDIIIFSYKKILKSGMIRLYLLLVTDFAVFGLFAFIFNSVLDVNVTSYLQFALVGVVTMIVAILVYFALIPLVRYDVFVTLKELFAALLNKKNRKTAEE